jgi:hypothetical protein
VCPLQGLAVLPRGRGGGGRVVNLQVGVAVGGSML